MRRQTGPRAEVIRRGIRELDTGAFAIVMATGIVGIAAGLLGRPWAAWLLFRLAEAEYGILGALALLRLGFHFPRMVADLANPSAGPGFLTAVAATCVLGSQFVLVAADPVAATRLWFLGIFLWAVLLYAFLAGVMVRARKPAIQAGVNGLWLMPTVATQSVSVLGTLLAQDFGVSGGGWCSSGRWRCISSEARCTS